MVAGLKMGSEEADRPDGGGGCEGGRDVVGHGQTMDFRWANIRAGASHLPRLVRRGWRRQTQWRGCCRGWLEEGCRVVNN